MENLQTVSEFNQGYLKSKGKVNIDPLLVFFFMIK